MLQLQITPTPSPPYNTFPGRLIGESIKVLPGSVLNNLGVPNQTKWDFWSFLDKYNQSSRLLLVFLMGLHAPNLLGIPLQFIRLQKMHFPLKESSNCRPMAD